jgi:S1-C subfamily serine protease
VSSRHVQRNAWIDETPTEEVGVFVHSPPADSAAARGGLQHGDIILAADDQEIGAFSKLQEVVKGHQSGETIELQVRRGSGELTDVQVVRP